MAFETESLKMAKDVLERIPPAERRFFAPKLLVAAAFRDAELRAPPRWLQPFIDSETWKSLPTQTKQYAARLSEHKRSEFIAWLGKKEESCGKEEGEGAAQEKNDFF